MLASPPATVLAPSTIHSGRAWMPASASARLIARGPLRRAARVGGGVLQVGDVLVAEVEQVAGGEVAARGTVGTHDRYVPVVAVHLQRDHGQIRDECQATSAARTRGSRLPTMTASEVPAFMCARIWTAASRVGMTAIEML